MYNVYGTSETGVIAVATPSDLHGSPESVGRALTGVKLDILDDRKRPLPQGEPGELWVTQNARRIATGDIGYLNSAGQLFLLGRSDDMINCGGEKIYPQALEAMILERLPYVLECAITAVPDSAYGQATQLFLVLKTPCSTDAIQADLAQFLPRSIRPKVIHIVSDLPRNALGKLERFKLLHSQPMK
jgi:acyl-coenzyme A synthetase/AMP-(fatty) acid ligase